MNLQTGRPDPLSGQLEKDVAALNAQLALLIDEVGFRFSNTERKLQKIETQLQAIEERVTALEAAMI